MAGEYKPNDRVWSEKAVTQTSDNQAKAESQPEGAQVGQSGQGEPNPRNDRPDKPLYQEWLDLRQSNLEAFFTGIGALATVVAAIASIAALIVLSIQTAATRRSVEATRKSVINQDRPYVLIVGPKMSMQSPTADIDAHQWTVDVRIENYGRTPAILHAFYYAGPYTDFPDKPQYQRLYRIHRVVAPIEQAREVADVPPFRLINTLFNPESATTVAQNPAYCWAYAEYTDVFGVRRRTGAAFRFERGWGDRTVSLAGGKAYNYDREIPERPPLIRRFASWVYSPGRGF